MDSDTFSLRSFQTSMQSVGLALTGRGLNQGFGLLFQADRHLRDSAGGNGLKPPAHFTVKVDVSVVKKRIEGSPSMEGMASRGAQKVPGKLRQPGGKKGQPRAASLDGGFSSKTLRNRGVLTV